MTIDASDRLIAALQALNAADVAELPPAERRRLIEALERAHRIAKGANPTRAKSGILADLRDGRGRQ